MVTQNRFYTRKGSNLKLTSLEQASGWCIALPRQWYTLQYLTSRGFSDIFAVSSASKMVDLFSKGRTDVLRSVISACRCCWPRWACVRIRVEAQYSFLQHQSYLGFSPATDPALVARWQAALDEMKRDGSFGRIYQRWFSHLPMPEMLLQLLVVNE